MENDGKGGPGGAHSNTPSDWAEAGRKAAEFKAKERAKHEARIAERAAERKAKRQAGLESGEYGPPNPRKLWAPRPPMKRDW
jgi:hypothetical protein